MISGGFARPLTDKIYKRKFNVIEHSAEHLARACKNDRKTSLSWGETENVTPERDQYCSIHVKVLYTAQS